MGRIRPGYSWFSQHAKGGHSGLVGCFLLIAISVAVAASTFIPGLHSQATVTECASTMFSISATRETWHGRTVYRLDNQSDVRLQHVSVRSWSGELLPYLHIGRYVDPPTIPSSALQAPPYTVPLQASLWFVGPIPPPARFKVYWSLNNKMYTASVAVQEGS